MKILWFCKVSFEKQPCVGIDTNKLSDLSWVSGQSQVSHIIWGTSIWGYISLIVLPYYLREDGKSITQLWSLVFAWNINLTELSENEKQHPRVTASASPPNAKCGGFVLIVSRTGVSVNQRCPVTREGGQVGFSRRCFECWLVKNWKFCCADLLLRKWGFDLKI